MQKDNFKTDLILALLPASKQAGFLAEKLQKNRNKIDLKFAVI